MAGPLLILFALLWSGMVFAFDGVMARNAFKQFESRNFPSVAGTVTHSEVESHRGSKGGTYYSALIRYHYTVSGHPYSGERMRFVKVNSSNWGAVTSLVSAHPVGSVLQVYYNPADPNESLLSPGIIGADLMMVLLLTPFNMVVLAFWTGAWGSVRGRLYKPVAGGVKIIEEGLTTRIRLPQFAAIWWGVGTTGILGFVSMFAVGFPTGMHPPMSLIVPVIFAIYLAGILVYFWQKQKINSGLDDLVINAGARTLELPLTYGRKERITVRIPDIETLRVEVIEHHNNKGGVSWSYAPTLTLRENKLETQKLADWYDKLKANEFAKWLGGTLGVSTEEAN